MSTSAAPSIVSSPTTTPAGTAIRGASTALLEELLFQAPARGSWVLDGGAKGLIEELRTIAATDASREVIPGRGTIAGHARHVRFFLGLFNAWARGENPWGTADWSDAWAHQQVGDGEWRALLDELAAEARAWTDAVREAPAAPALRGDVDDAVVAKHLVGSVAHVAYHFGAVRQLVGALRAVRSR